MTPLKLIPGMGINIGRPAPVPRKIASCSDSQFIDGKSTSYDVVSEYANTEGLCRRFYFGPDNLFLGEPKFRNAVNEHASRSMEGFIDGDIMSHPA